jgi:hypothetical protein
MLRLLFDHNFNHRILRGLEKRIPNLDYTTPQKLNRIKEKDSEHLEWAEKENRVIVTHDVNTFTDAAYKKILNGEKMFGLIVVPQNMPIGVAIDELEIITTCSKENEFENRIEYLPLF